MSQYTSLPHPSSADFNQYSTQWQFHRHIPQQHSTSYSSWPIEQPLYHFTSTTLYPTQPNLVFSSSDSPQQFLPPTTDSFISINPPSPPPSPWDASKSSDSGLYQITGSQSSRQPSEDAPPLVKVEQDEGGDPFIMELSPNTARASAESHFLAPPIQVPLRANWAPKEMRKMMGAFHLNPFAMHKSGGRRVLLAASREYEAHPLDEEPLIFEFQIEINAENSDHNIDSSQEPSRTSSPDSEAHNAPDEGRHETEWEDVQQNESVYASTPLAWGYEYPASSEGSFSPSGSSLSHTTTRRSSRHSSSSRAHNTVRSHPYLRNTTTNNLHDVQGYTSHNNNIGSFANREYVNQVRETEASEWSRTGYLSSSRRGTYTSNSPACDPSTLPSTSLNASRRWSLPDTHPYHPTPFLIQS